MKEGKTYHRLGEPGGPSVPTAKIDIHIRQGKTGEVNECELWDVGSEVSEIDLLRTIAHKVAVTWGQDEFGWWAVMPKDYSDDWEIWRQDDHGNDFLVKQGLTETEAQAQAKEFDALGHKQHYWIKKCEPEV